MRIPRIHCEQEITAPGTIKLSDRTAHYLRQVLRLQQGSPVTLFDGSGGEWQAQVAALDRKSVKIDAQKFIPVDHSSPLAIHLGIGLSRGERMDWIVQKATELGVRAITPLLTERCEVKLKGDRLAKRMQHWQSVCISACEQCGLNLVPELHVPVALDSWSRANEANLKLVLHPQTDNRLETHRTPTSILLAVGSEGGFTDQEIQHLGTRDFIVVRLGERILRTETAPLTALSILQHKWGDLDF